MNDVALSLIGTECKSACAGEPDFEQRVRKAMAVVANGHWMYCADLTASQGSRSPMHWPSKKRWNWPLIDTLRRLGFIGFMQETCSKLPPKRLRYQRMPLSMLAQV